MNKSYSALVVTLTVILLVFVAFMYVAYSGPQVIAFRKDGNTLLLENTFLNQECWDNSGKIDAPSRIADFFYGPWRSYKDLAQSSGPFTVSCRPYMGANSSITSVTYP